MENSPQSDSPQSDDQPAPLGPHSEAPPVYPELVGPGPGPAAGIRPPAPGPWRRVLTWIGWTGFLVCAIAVISQYSTMQQYYDTTGGIREKYHSGTQGADDKVAIIRVRGIIMQGDGFVKHQIDRIRSDPSVKAVVLRVESPGGTVTGADYIYHHLLKLRDERKLPIVVSMGSIATSGGYYVSMAVGDQPETIYAEPTTTTGSIGVIMPHYDVSGLMAKLQIQDDSISSHPRKQLLSMTRPMSEDDRKLVQEYIDESFERFKQIVKSGRPALAQANPGPELRDVKTDRNLATGEIFSATRALQFGLIDHIGFIEDAVARAIELADLDAADVSVIQYQREFSMMGLFGLTQARSQGLTIPDLLQWSAPRAFYLSSLR